MQLGGLPASTTYAGVAAALASASGTTTIGNSLVVQKANIGATPTTGFLLQNPTASSAGTPVQQGPQWASAGSAYVTGAPRTMGYAARVEPRTSGHVDLVFEYDNGSGPIEILRLTSSEPNLFAAGVLAYRFISSSGGYIFQDGGGVFRYRRGRGGTELYSASFSDPAEVTAEAAVRRSPRASDGAPYLIDEAGAGTTTNTSTAVVATFSPPTDCKIDAEATVEADAAGDSAVMTRRRRFKVAGGTVTALGATQTVGADDVEAALSGVAFDIEASGGSINAVFTGINGKTISAGGSMSLKVFEV